MNIIEQYETLVNEQKWEQAIPLIKKIIDYLCQTFKEEIDIIFESEEFSEILDK